LFLLKHDHCHNLVLVRITAPRKPPYLAKNAFKVEILQGGAIYLTNSIFPVFQVLTFTAYFCMSHVMDGAHTRRSAAAVTSSNKTFDFALFC
jgi:hypothetical protein